MKQSTDTGSTWYTVNITPYEVRSLRLAAEVLELEDYDITAQELRTIADRAEHDLPW